MLNTSDQVDRLQALATATAEVAQAGDGDAVAQALVRAASAVHLNALVAQVGADEQSVVVQKVGLIGGVAQAIERVIGRGIVGISMPIDGVDIVRQAIRSRQISYTADGSHLVHQALPWLPEPAVGLASQLGGVRQLVCAPIIVEARPVAVVAMWGPSLTSADLPTIGVLAEVAGITIERLRVVTSERQRTRQLAAASRAAEVILTPTDLAATFEALASQVVGLLNASGVSIHLVEAPPPNLRVRWGLLSPFAQRYAAAGNVLPGPGRLESFVLDAITSQRPVFIGDYRAVPPVDRRPWLEPVASLLVVPLVALRVTVGFMMVFWTSPRPENPSDLAQATALAPFAALAIRHARLLETERVARSEALIFKQAADSALEFIVLVDGRGSITYANPALEQAHGYGPAELIGRRIDELVAPDEAAMVRDAGLPGGWESIRWHRRKDGSHLPVLLTFSQVRDDRGETLGKVGVGRDVRGLLAEQGRARKVAQLDGAVKTARAICHQLNNDLSVVIGSLELMQINPVPIPPELQALFATANEGAERVTASIDQLSRIVRFEVVDTPVGPALDLSASAAPVRPPKESGETPSC
jgi:PAS domain S-box-containing protein